MATETVAPETATQTITLDSLIQSTATNGEMNREMYLKHMGATELLQSLKADGYEIVKTEPAD